MQPNIKKKNTEEKSLNGIELLLNRFYHEYSKLPMLEVILQKFTHELSNKLRNVVQGIVEVNLQSFKSIKFQKFFNNLGKYYTIIVFKAVEWNTSSILVFNNKTVLSFLNIIFGGKKCINLENASNLEKNLTSIEQNIAKFLGEVILSSLSDSFKEVVVSNFQIDHLENNYKFLNVSNSEEYGVLMSLEMKIENISTDHFDLIFPYKSLEPIKSKLQRSFISEENMSSQIDESAMIENLDNLEILLECKICTNDKNLSDITNLKKNDILIFDQGKDDPVELYHQDVKIASGKLGKIGDKVALEISN
ncbi:MAG: FliM/FliN family flagellar motor switch protein [Rickettsia sp.]|nr:FliM/FliN family flagellar motor switch protein [Rickettsia sp.]